MIFLSERERQMLAKSPTKTYIVTYTFGKEIKSIEVEGKSCGAIPLADEVSVFSVYNELGIESFVCDFSNFISVIEKPLRRKSKSSNPLRIVRPQKATPNQ